MAPSAAGPLAHVSPANNHVPIELQLEYAVMEFGLADKALYCMPLADLEYHPVALQHHMVDRFKHVLCNFKYRVELRSLSPH